MMIKRVLLAAALLGLLAGVPAAGAMEFIEGPQGVDPFAAPEEEGQAVETAAAAALDWLKLTDAGEYQKSWEVASHLFRLAVAPDDWQRQLRAGRGAMGKLVERRRQNAQYSETLPGAPDGVYVVLQYVTQFSRKSSAVETVTLQLEGDGVWRVGGYYIR